MSRITFFFGGGEGIKTLFAQLGLKEADTSPVQYRLIISHKILNRKILRDVRIDSMKLIKLERKCMKLNVGEKGKL